MNNGIMNFNEPTPLANSISACPSPSCVEVCPEDEGSHHHESPLDMMLGDYSCKFVTNIPPTCNKDDSDATSNPRMYFDLGLRHFFAYHHEEAYKFFLACVTLAPDCAFAHGLIALCHCPNYNFKGNAYYESTHRPDEEESISIRAEVGGTTGEDIAVLRRLYPSQQVAMEHALLAVKKVQELNERHQRRQLLSMDHEQSSEKISEIESQILAAIHTLTCYPGIDPPLAEGTVGRPYANALRKLYQRYPEDAEVAYFFAESLMVLNAWNLYEYPTGRPLSEDIDEIETVLEQALQLHPRHAGICHLYVHLCEMSSHPEKALSACQSLREEYVCNRVISRFNLVTLPPNSSLIHCHFHSLPRFFNSAFPMLVT